MPNKHYVNGRERMTACICGCIAEIKRIGLHDNNHCQCIEYNRILRRTPGATFREPNESSFALE